MSKTIYRLMGFVAVLALAFGGGFTSAVFAAPGTHTMPTGMLNSSTYYVSPTGSDSNPGTISAPFKTFKKAVSMLKAGDTLMVTAGTYSETLTLSSSGTATAPITVIGSGAVLNMQGANQNGITVKGSYVRVSGFEVVGAVDFGIIVSGTNDTVENNNVHDNVTRNGVGICGLSSSWGSAVKVVVGGGNTTIRSNTVHDNCGEGIVVTRGPTAVIENNTVYDNFGVNIYIDNSPFVTARNNTAYCTGTHLRNGNRATGIALGEESYSGWGAQLHDILISGNVIEDCNTGIAAYASNVGGTLTNVTMANNNVPSGEKRSVSIQTLSNQNILISNNTLFNSIYVYQSAGVTLKGNVISNTSSTSTFADVYDTYWAQNQIESLYNAGITGGCNVSPPKYCPEDMVTRAQMAVFLLKGIHGSSYTPPSVSGSTGFNDVMSTYWAAAWIKQFAAEGITGGCGGGAYCPDTPVTRAQMAVFLLKARHGPLYTPPVVGTVTGFGDVPTTYWAAAWIKQLAAEGITGGCGGGNYCPDSPVTRAQMAVFLVKAFNLP